MMKPKHTVAALVLAFGCLIILRSAQGQGPVVLAQNPTPLAVGGQIQPVPAGTFYVNLKGKVQGEFKAETPATPQHTGTIIGIRFSYQLSSPVAASTGLVAGKRQYSPITFTKVWGPSSPQILQACSTNEALTVTFEFDHQKMTLTNATVSSVRRYIAVPAGNDPPDPRELEDISITFQTINVADAAGATTVDSWLAAP